ncbi:MAG: Gfo/Idh/MocA family oxidoreductase [Planctomycetes bacterium]|nr:Gfo/Idh/MocA family oxidoreductase [Planctomycetota bacterium]
MTMLRVGLSGCRGASHELVQAARTQHDCDVVALHDPDGEALAALQDATGIGIGTTDFTALLATGIDFVVLCGDVRERLVQVRAATEQAVPCLLASPCAPDPDTAAAMVAECERAQTKLGVLVPEFADPLYEQVRCMVADGWLGGIVAVQGVLGDRARLHGRDCPGTHPFVDLAARQVQLTTWLTGRAIVRVTAQASAQFGRSDDSAVATALLRGGAVCTFAASHVTMASAFALHGTDGGIRIAGDRIWLRGRARFDGQVFAYDTPDRELVLTRADLAPALRAAAPRFEPLGRFARWLEDTDDFPCPGEQATEDLRAVAAMLRALQSGRAEDVTAVQ